MKIKSKISLLIIILLIIFIFLIVPDVFSIPKSEIMGIKNFSIILERDINKVNDNQTSFLLTQNIQKTKDFKYIFKNKSPFYDSNLGSFTKKTIQIPISSSSSCKKIEKSKISDFIIPKT